MTSTSTTTNNNTTAAATSAPSVESATMTAVQTTNLHLPPLPPPPQKVTTSYTIIGGSSSTRRRSSRELYNNNNNNNNNNNVIEDYNDDDYYDDYLEPNNNSLHWFYTNPKKTTPTTTFKTKTAAAAARCLVVPSNNATAVIDMESFLLAAAMSHDPNSSDNHSTNHRGGGGEEKKESSSVVTISHSGDGGICGHEIFDDITCHPDHCVLPLKPVIMDYAWGIRGMDSRVARFALASGALSEIDPDVPYAELWIGTHPKGHAILQDGRFLQQALGGAELPFLFKILSAGKALSIQAHPDLFHAQRLHAENPAAYGDANHKPEMAIALTPFEAMCGFRRIEEIAIFLKKHPEFAACISQEAKLAIFLADSEEDKKKALQTMFHSFMTCPEETSSAALQQLLTRLQNEQSSIHPHPHDEPAWERKCARAILRLAQQFPNDAAAMAPFFLNYLLMAPGESFFMAANEPHAYVAGEIIECMACSDNVVRAGLTPKFKDVDNLVKMLTYSQGGPSIDGGAPLEHSNGRILRYTPPVPEFEVLLVTCPPGETVVLDIPEPVPAIVVILEGTGYMVDENMVCRPGRSYYLPAEAPPLTFSVPADKRGPLLVAVAHQNLHLNVPTTYLRSSHAMHAPTQLPLPEYDYEM